MATEPLQAPIELPGSAYIYWWEQLDGNGDVGVALEAPGAADKSVQVVGALGSSDVLTLQGSNVDPVSGPWFTLTDPAGADLTWTDGDEGDIKVILQNPRYIRPSLAVTTAADVDIYICARINK